MANFEVTGFNQLMRQLEETLRLDDIAKQMIDGALPILEGELKKAIREEADKGYATGELAESVKKSETKHNRYGYFGVAQPTGKDEKGVRNMEKLAYLHYGTSKQQARQAVTKAVIRAESKVIVKMQECYNRAVDADGSE